MTLRTVLLVLSWVLVGPAAAQEVDIRSGEHPGYSRLVFETPSAEPWELGRGPSGYLLRFENDGLRFDVSRVFQRMPRTRVTGVRNEADGVVAIDVAQNVHAMPFVLRPGVLVVDLRSGAPPADTPYEEPLAARLPTPPPEPPVPPRPRVRLPIDLGRGEADPLIEPFLRPEIRSAETDPRVASARSELMEQIARAAAQGLLMPAEDFSKKTTNPHPPEVSGDAAAQDPAAMVEEALAERPNLRIETSIDRGMGHHPEAGEIAAHGIRCYPDSYFDLAGWTADVPPGALIAQARAGLLTMRDEVDPKGAQSLARAYLSLGFGAEARAALRLTGESGRATRVWSELGAILDHGLAINPAVFDGQLACPSRTALWAALARPDLPKHADIDRDAIVRSFSDLPIHLRRHIGPILADRFLAAGDRYSAAKVRNAVTRAGESTHSEALELTEARLALAEGESEAADARLEAVVEDGRHVVGEALALRLQSTLDDWGKPSPEDIALAEALAFERRDTPLGIELRKLSLRGHGALGDFETAFAMLSHHALQDDGPLVSELLLRLAREGRDADLLRQAFGGVLSDRNLVAGRDAFLAVADRLARLGFAERAEEILADTPPKGDAAERLVRARLALAANRPGQALQYLAGLSGDEADRLRARAAQDQGDLATAARLYGAAGEPAREASLAWQSRDWNTVAESGKGSRREVAEDRLAPAATPEPAPSLGGARAALDRSAEIRERLDALLKDRAPSR